MSQISSDILLISADPRGLGGRPGVLTVEKVIADEVATDRIEENIATSVDAQNLRLNTTIGGGVVGVADGLATLDSNGTIPVSQIPDVVTGGLDAKGSCRVKTTAALPAYTAAGAQVGKTLTADANGVIPSIDGVTMALNDRVLVDQTGSATNVDNGIYVVTDLGSGSTPWILTRSTDADETGEVSTGTYTFIEEGNSSGTTGYIVDTPNPIVVDTTGFTWSIFSSSITGTTSMNNTVIGQTTLGNLTSGVRNTGSGFTVFNALTEGNDNTAMGHLTLQQLVQGSENTAFGSNSMSLTLGNVTANTAFGFDTLKNLTTGTDNVCLGHSAGVTMTTGNRNTGVGSSALLDVIGGNNNTGVGYEAGTNVSSGNNNTSLGAYSLQSCNVGAQNTAIGSEALQGLVSGTGNTAVGHQSLEQHSTSNSTGVGFQALATCTAQNNTSLGSQSGGTITSGEGNTMLGASTSVDVGNAEDRIAIGRAAVVTDDFSCQIGESVASAGSSAQLRFRSQIIGDEAWRTTPQGIAVIDASGNIVKQVGSVLTGTITTDNTGVGDSALNALTTGVDNSAFGVNALNSLTEGDDNTVLGDNAGAALTTSNKNTAIGSKALQTLTITADANTAIGFNALNATTTANNVAVGAYSLQVNNNGTNNTAVGTNSLLVNVSGSSNTAMGYQALQAATAASNNTALGFESLFSTTGSTNTAVGQNSGRGITTGSENSAFGVNALLNAGATTSNTAVGTNSLTGNIGSNNTAVGAASLQSNTGSRNTAVGTQAAPFNAAFNNTVSVGYRANFVNTGADNVSVGAYSSVSNTSGINNTAVGTNALRDNVTTNNNTALGFNTLLTTTGTQNTAVGATAGDNIIGGANNTCVGFAADPSGATANFQISIGSGAVPNATDHSVQLGRNADDNSGVMRFKSQIVSDEAWIGTGKITACIDDAGNIVKGGASSGGGVENISAATATPGPAAAADPSIDLQTTFVSTTGTSGTATGELGSPTVDGFQKIIVAVGIASGTTYDLDVTTNTAMIDANGNVVSTVRFESSGNSVELIWDNTNSQWCIIGSGVTLI